MKLVLVVDDDPAIREVIGEMLREEGFGVSFAHSGRTTWEQLHAERPDLVILDVKIPDGDGHEMLDAMQAQREFRAIPVILMSTHETCGRTNPSVVTYLTKPFDLDHLVRLVVVAMGAPS
jgi:CheY-like chemotaxis protein